jgi:hypothetical protein
VSDPDDAVLLPVEKDRLADPSLPLSDLHSIFPLPDDERPSTQPKISTLSLLPLRPSPVETGNEGTLGEQIIGDETEMKRSRLLQEQIIGILKEHQAGLSAADLPEGRHERRDVLQLAL